MPTLELLQVVFVVKVLELLLEDSLEALQEESMAVNLVDMFQANCLIQFSK